MNLLFRTDASPAIGTGHVMRCLALAQTLQDVGAHAVFAMVEATPSVEDRLRSESIDLVRVGGTAGTLEDSDQTAQLAARGNAEWIVVDGYQFGADYSAELRRKGHKVLFIDDNGHAEHYSADLVLNQNAYASEDLYRNREKGTELLLGLHYAMLRREFRTWTGARLRNADLGCRVLVTLGGSCGRSLTLRVMQGVQLVPPEKLEVTIVAGGSSELGEVQTAAAKAGICLLGNVTNMPELMAWADIAVSAAGTTVLEFAFMGVPAVLLTVADNQQLNAQAWDKLGFAQNLGDAAQVSQEQIAGAVSTLIADPERRARMAQSARNLVDGLGAGRVAARLAAGNRRERNG